MSKKTMSLKASPVLFNNVSKTFGKNSLAVKDISFTIKAGELVTLLGPSGCGKTTTLRMIAGLEMPTSGEIYIGDRDVTKLPATDRDVSMVFQSYALFPHMNILENVSYGLKFSGFSRDEIRERAAAGLELVGLERLAQRLPGELSGGQQQRAAVARAIVLEPQVLLLDEPLSNLDAKLRRSVREEIRELQQNLGLTVAYVTHDQEEALAVSDRIIVMKNAEIAQHGTPKELYEHPADTFVADFIGESNLLECDVVSLKDQKAGVTVGDLSLTVPQGAYRSGHALLAVRPSHIALRRDSGPDSFPAVIEKANYLGIGTEYKVKGKFGMAYAMSPDTTTPFDVGERVYLTVDSQKAVLVQKSS